MDGVLLAPLESGPADADLAVLVTRLLAEVDQLRAEVAGCGVRIWNCGSRSGIGAADMPMPCGVSRRWNRKTNSSAVRFASCKPSALAAVLRSNPVATARMISMTPRKPSRNANAV